jgi:methionyl-tRNA formyltransferase
MREIMRIVFFGTPEFAVPALECLLNHPEFRVIAVVTQPDKRRGRGSQMTPSAVKTIALEHQLPVWQPEKIKKDPETISQLKNSSADVFVVVAYGQILPSEILTIPKLGCINVHGSLLPQYRGAAPIQWSLSHGESQTGVTTMLMDEGMDTGPILLKSYTPIGLLDNAHQIATTLASLGADLLTETLNKLAGKEISPIPQNPEQATYAPLLQKSDYVLNWSKSALELHNQIRGFFPNCVTSLRNKQLKVFSTVPLGEEYWEQLPTQYQKLQTQWESLSSLEGNPGEVVSILKNFGPIVQTGKGLLLLQQVQIADKRPQSGWDFVNGMHLFPRENLG